MSVGAEACDPSLQLAGCVLIFQRLYVAHMMSVKLVCLLHKILSIKPKYVRIAIDTILIPGVAKWHVLRKLSRAS